MAGGKERVSQRQDDYDTTPSLDVLGAETFPVEYQGRIVEGSKVIGQITPNRARLHYELEFVRDAVRLVRQASAAEMMVRLDILDDKILQLAIGVDEVLKSLGDTDPRHP